MTFWSQCCLTNWYNLCLYVCTQHLTKYELENQILKFQLFSQPRILRRESSVIGSHNSRNRENQFLINNAESCCIFQIFDFFYLISWSGKPVFIVRRNENELLLKRSLTNLGKPSLNQGSAFGFWILFWQIK